MSIEITIHHGKQGHTVYQFGIPSFSPKMQKNKEIEWIRELQITRISNVVMYNIRKIFFNNYLIEYNFLKNNQIMY